MAYTTNELIAQRVASTIIQDIDGRSGGDHWLDSMTPDVQAELREQFEAIVLAGVEGRLVVNRLGRYQIQEAE
jgi:hypothetical protein